MENNCNSPPITDTPIDKNVLDFLTLLIEADLELRIQEKKET